MSWIDVAGYAAAFCTTAAYVSQALRAWKTRSCKDVSLKMLMLLMTGFALWLLFGLYRSEYSIVGANGVSFLLAAVILFVKLRCGNESTSG